ncbi:MAG: response regulator [Fidelibacterota bacterium]
MKQILIIEDESDILELIQFNLENAGYRCHGSLHGDRGLTWARNHRPDLIILDIMLPGINGLDICRLLKGDHNTDGIPILMVTARGEEADIIRGLEIGADDYMTKPFSPRVLVARVEALLRRSRRYEDSPDVLVIEGITIDKSKHIVSIDGQRIDLTKSEFRILSLLASHPGWVYTRNQIIEYVHGDHYPVTDRSVDFQIVGLRKKIKDKGEFIQTVRGVGYKFKHEKF